MKWFKKPKENPIAVEFDRHLEMLDRARAASIKIPLEQFIMPNQQLTKINWFQRLKEKQRAYQARENWRQQQYQNGLNTLFQITIEELKKDEPIIQQHLKQGICRLPSCNKKQYSDGLCEGHYKWRYDKKYRRVQSLRNTFKLLHLIRH